MSKPYHYNPETGQTNMCDAKPGKCPLRSGDLPLIHGTKDEVMAKVAELNEKKEGGIFNMPQFSDEEDPMSKFYTKELNNRLLAAATNGMGVYNKEYSTQRGRDANIYLLGSDEVIGYYTEQSKDPVDWKPMHTLAQAIIAKAEVTGRDKNEIAKEVLNSEAAKGISDKNKRSIAAKVKRGQDKDALAKTSSFVFATASSPFFSKAKELVRQDDLRVMQECKKTGIVPGYDPQEYKGFDVSENDSIMERISVNDNMLPEKTLSFDLETDTENGYGLRSTKAQITEIVVSRKDKSILLSGDEKHILTQFARIMNNADEDTELVGWNSRGFDNIFLDTRAKLHGIKGWGGAIEDDKKAPAGMPPIDGYETPQKMIWRKPDGKCLKEVDAMMAKKRLDLEANEKTGNALKSYTTEILGMTPIKLDRSVMHEYSAKERRDYTISDGIATLAAYKNIKDRRRNLRTGKEKRREKFVNLTSYNR